MKKTKMIVYKITNTITGEMYIGKTQKGIKRRFSQHLRNAQKGSKDCPFLYNAIRKYGIENFIIEIVNFCKDTETLNKQEKFWIQKLDTLKNGYNLTPGGDGVIMDSKIKEKLSNSHKGKKLSKEHKENIRKGLRGIKRKKETRDIISKNTKKQWENSFFRETVAQKNREIILKNNRKKFNVYEAICLEKARPGVKALYKKGNIIGIWENQSTCAQDLNLLKGTINLCLYNRQKTYNGFIFEYIGEDYEQSYRLGA